MVVMLDSRLSSLGPRPVQDHCVVFLDKRHFTCTVSLSNQECKWPGGGGGSLPYGLYRDVLLDRVWFLASLPRTRYTISCEPVLDRVSTCPKQGMSFKLF